MSSNIQNAMTVLLICILIFGLNWSSNQYGSAHQEIRIQFGKRPKPNYLKKSEYKSGAYEEERVLSKWNNYSNSIQRICRNHSNYPSMPHFYIDTQHKLSYCKVPKVDNPKKVLIQYLFSVVKFRPGKNLTTDNNFSMLKPFPIVHANRPSET